MVATGRNHAGAGAVAQDWTYRRWVGLVRILFGLIWLANTVLQANPAYIAHFTAMMAADWHQGQPAAIAGYGHATATWIGATAPAAIAWATVALDALLAVSLLSGVGLRVLAWVGALYSLWLWSTTGGFGGPYTPDTTDPGVGIIYALCFLLAAWTRSWEELSLARTEWRAPNPAAIAVGRVLFGLLWLFDAAWKWTPYFLTHGAGYVHKALAGQPDWIHTYISAFITAIAWLGALPFGVLVALLETMLALSLIFGVALRWTVPVGFVYSLGVWTTAEGWGGPYSPGATSTRGDLVGISLLYAVAFLFLAGWVYWRPRRTVPQ